MFAVVINIDGIKKTTLFSSGTIAKEACLQLARKGIPAMKIRSAL